MTGPFLGQPHHTQAEHNQHIHTRVFCVIKPCNLKDHILYLKYCEKLKSNTFSRWKHTTNNASELNGSQATDLILFSKFTFLLCKKFVQCSQNDNLTQ